MYLHLHFSRLNEVEDFSPLTFPANQKEHCDILVEKPTLFMKLDAGMLRTSR